MAWTKIHTGVQPRLNAQETNALKSHVKEWEKATARDAKILAPKMDTELLKQRKQWFHNHKKVQANFKAPSKLQKKWTACQVIEEECKAEILQQICEEIEEETGQKAAHKEVLRRYQPTMTAFMLWLDKKELQEAQAKAEKWTNQAPNAAVQAKTARKKGEKMVKSFAKDMYIQAGMRVFFLGSWKDEKGRLLISGFDFNEQLSKGSSFIKCKDWQVILLSWEDFIGDAFDQDEDQDVRLLGGLLMFPEIDSLPLKTKKAMIWSFLTIHYRKCCGKPNVPVPWNNIMKGQLRFISSTYLPDDAKILEPSKMLRKDANAILHFWWDQQENQVGLTFKFKGWIDDKGRMHSPIARDESDGDGDDESLSARPTKQPSATTPLSLTSIPKGQMRTARRPYFTSTNDEFNNTEAEASPPQVKRHAHHLTNITDSDRCWRDQMMKSMAIALVNSQLKAAIVPMPSAQVQLAKERTLKRTRAARDVSSRVEEKQARNMPAPREQLPRKAKVAKLAAGVSSDAPAKGTRSNAETSCAT
ncbi:hypothetical protein BDR04DRAFT_1118628 [Suillus decipiens]|nr:hypothetical protein BDR04DRAFT_1118628 [Suillus decipiens]